MVRMGTSTKLAAAELFQPLRNCNLREGFFLRCNGPFVRKDNPDTSQGAFTPQTIEPIALLQLFYAPNWKCYKKKKQIDIAEIFPKKIGENPARSI